MPIAMDPSATFEVVLDTDSQKHKGQTPTFTFRQITCRERLEIIRKGESARGPVVQVETLLNATLGSIKIGLVDWRHMKDRNGQDMAFDIENLEAIVTLDEACELLEKMVEGGAVSEDDAKK